MPRIIILQDFSYKPSAQQTFFYEKGDVVLVKQEIAELAIAEKKAELTEDKTVPAGIKETIKKFPTKNKKKET